MSVDLPRPIGVAVRHRLAIGILAGLVAGVLEYLYLSHVSTTVAAFDFTWAWRGGQALLRGQNPYIVIRPIGAFPYNSAFKYPLPVAVFGIPFAHLSPHIAGAAFGAFSVALFAFALTRDGYWRLPALVSAPALVTLAFAQWSFLLTTAAIVPALSWLACLKPTTGLASFAYRPRVSAVIGGAVAYLGCMLLVPNWPRLWVESMLHDPSTHWYVPAVAIAGGPLLLLAILKWRTPEARLLLVLALVPQVQAFYSGLVAQLVARSFRESAWLAIISCVGYVAWAQFDWSVPDAALQDPVHHAPWLLMSVYLPALVVILRRPNEGRIPARLERAISRWPMFLRGTSGALDAAVADNVQ